MRGQEGSSEVNTQVSLPPSVSSAVTMSGHAAAALAACGSFLVFWVMEEGRVSPLLGLTFSSSDISHTLTSTSEAMEITSSE